jgi:3-hydroxybutyrate dehydrogenase
MKHRPLEGKLALVTGATGGLGLSIAETLARSGCAVILNGIAERHEMTAVTQRIEQEHGVPVAYRRANLAEVAEIEDLAGSIAAETKGIDILVNNAVVRHFSPIDSFPTERWNEAVAVNISAPFHLIRLLLPGMRTRDFGRIFNMVSVYGMRGTTNRIDYVASKSALIGMTRAVALETLDHNVTCHAICPGTVLTPGTDDRVVRLMAETGKSRLEAEREFLRHKQPTGRFVEPENVGDLIVFLCGPAGRDMTGGVLPVDGGWLAD